MITLPKLPVDPKSFGDFISEKTFEFHYGKHHKGYVDNLNKLIKGTEFEDSKLEDIVQKAHGPIFNNAAQVWNHTFFWNSLDAKSSEDDISERLQESIDRSSYGSLDSLKKEFVNKATKQFGSGWVWLVMSEGELLISTTSNADTPIREGKRHRPLLVCDLWEHAYYLDHQNDRAGFVEAFLKHANWKFASDNAWNK